MDIIKKLTRTTIKNQMILMLVLLASAGGIKQGLNNVVPQIIICLVSAGGLDLLITFVKTRKYIFPASAVISALIIALLLEPGVSWYVAVSASLAAIASKHLIRFKGKHIFNPASFGLLTAIFVFPVYLAWWGAGVNWILVPMGLFIVYRFKRFHLVTSYALVQTMLLGIIFLHQGQSLTNALLMVNLFFIFVMIIEPKTSPLSIKGRIVFGALVGASSAVFLTVLPSYDPSVLGLLLANISVPVLNRIK